MMLIFSFSAQVADDSNNLSTGVTEIVVETVEKVAPNADLDVETLNGIIRKNAHFIMYFILGILVFSALGSNMTFPKRLVAALLICSLYAATDEIHQMFVPGRGPAVFDVFIDTSGTCAGILTYIVIINVFFKEYRGIIWCLETRGLQEKYSMYMVIKRLIDIVLSFIGIVILSPVFLILIIMIKLDSKGPVLFKQKRVGMYKTHFNILKFRSMRIDTPKDMPTHLLDDPEKWLTKTGKVLRKTSLDELPQIINILKGEMSIIGPRPALWNQYDLIEERDKYGANDVPVGLTGWAQINGRDEISIEDKARFDGEYVEKSGLMMDLKCFFGTISKVISSEGYVEGGSGSNKKMTDIR